MTLPKEFEKRMRDILGDDFDAFKKALESSPVRALRVNTIKCSTEEFEKLFEFKHEKLPFADAGYIFECEHIGSHPLHHAGAIYVQEPAAMSPVECVEIEPGMKILDLCASPGGKSTQAASKLCGKGVIVSNEIDTSRVQILAQNIERMGVRGAVVTNTDSATLAHTYKNFFDLVIVDAPCSGEGMMRKNPLAISEWSIENIEMSAMRQKEILENAAGMVKGGGKLLYSTCTFAPEENEMQIADFLTEHSDFHLIPVSDRVQKVTKEGLSEYGGEKMKLCRRFYPHISLGEGQFMALLERDAVPYQDEADINESRRKAKGDRSQKKDSQKRRGTDEADEAVIKEFLIEGLSEEGLLEIERYDLKKKGDGSYSLVADIPLPENEKVIKCAGVIVGSVQKGRVIPHHNFFMAYGNLFKRKIVLSLDTDAEKIKKYLHGESIFTECDNGFAAVLIGSSAVGGAKVSASEAKNYYPKGLRM
ncbi:MAG: RsmD family RNA methyltransferase [Clostridia bacterium]|nr:RsmD family RNA methyltransferase [Clostridia bacterium]